MESEKNNIAWRNSAVESFQQSFLDSRENPSMNFGSMISATQSKELMIKALQTLRAVRWAMLASIVLYVIMGEVVGPASRGVDPALSYLLATLSVAIVGAIFVVRRTLVLRAAESLATRPEDSLSLDHWRTGYIVTYALCEALALFGLVLRFRASPTQASVPYYLGGFVLLLFFRPKQPVSA
jgi:F0F1-type ATP synthase membrane subunit c/vacuolar-type H+-ATPase subunit K